MLICGSKVLETEEETNFSLEFTDHRELCLDFLI